MNALAKKVIQKVWPKGNAIPIAALDDFLSLLSAAESATTPTQSDAISDAAALDLPVEVGGVRLWRLSLGACEWLEQVERDWFANEPRTMDIATVWAYAHARDLAAFANMGGATATRFKLYYWARRQSAAWEAMVATVRAITPKQPRQDSTAGQDETLTAAADGENYLGSVIEALLINYGQTVEYWLWTVSAEQTASLIVAIHARGSALDGGGVAQPNARQVAAHANFVRCAKAFEKKWGKHGPA